MTVSERSSALPMVPVGRWHAATRLCQLQCCMQYTASGMRAHCHKVQMQHPLDKKPHISHWAACS